MKGNHCLKAVIAFLASFAISASASAVTLYFDDFSGSSGDSLIGTTPDTTVGANTWTGSSVWRADGSFNYISDQTVKSAVLSFTPVAGNIYTLSANVSITQDNGLLLYFGNSNTGVFGGTPSTDNTAGIRVDSFGTTQVQLKYSDKDADGEFTSLPGTFPQPGLAQIVLDTSTPTWSAYYSYNGSSLGSVSNIVPGNIDSVGVSINWFNTTNPTGIVDNFTLTVEPVPEPSSHLLLMAGLGASFLLIRRRHKESSR